MIVQLQRDMRAQLAHGLHVWHAHLPLSSGSLQCSSCLRASTTLLPRTDKLRPLPAKRPVIKVPLSIEFFSKVDVQCAMQ